MCILELNISDNGAKTMPKIVINAGGIKRRKSEMQNRLWFDFFWVKIYLRKTAFSALAITVHSTTPKNVCIKRWKDVALQLDVKNQLHTKSLHKDFKS